MFLKSQRLSLTEENKNFACWLVWMVS
ncbi:unnamed protein product, partial [Vitis vinifera]|uniref:Uncharacterized protein n=1 Tax=Vitis vinifera TaxID=29760 RepID=D7SHS5_VITVI